jgi:hypothetical protein
MWCFRRTKNISCADSVRKEALLHKVKEEKSVLDGRKEGRKAALITSCAGTSF